MNTPMTLGPCGPLQARFTVPPSKSLTNRALIALAVAGGGVVTSPLDCEDTRLLAAALRDAGWPVIWKDAITIGSRDFGKEKVRVDLGNSGTGSRLLLSLVAALPGDVVLDGSERLRERPMKPLITALKSLGAEIDDAPGGFLPISIRGQKLKGGEVILAPGASSQFVTSLLMAAPLMEHGLTLALDGHIPSRPYLDLTEAVMRDFGAKISRSADGRHWHVSGQPLVSRTYDVEGDWSSAAFFLAAVAVAGGRVHIGPLSQTSRQGDRVMCKILESSGMSMRFDDDGVIAEGPVTRPVEADLADCPDLFPALSVVAAAAPAGSRLTGLEFLRHKESDRLSVMAANLERLGVQNVASTDDFQVISKLERSSIPIAVTAAGDHRIAMAMAVAALRAGELVIDDTDCVQKSFPTFWQQWGVIT